MTSYLVMLQTNSNQPFIFSSPRLREQIGASFEITLLSHWVAEVVQGLVSKNRPGKNKRRTNFWVSDSSGKVIVRFTEKDGEPGDLAKKLITQVTQRALTDAPGLDVTGVFIETSSGPVDPADLKRLDREFSEYSLNRRPAAARFPQFPFLERGSESALPASPKLSEDDCREMRRYARETLNVPLLTGEDTNFSPPTQTDQDAQETLSLPSRVKRAWSRSARRLQLQDVVSRWSPENQSSWSKRIEDLSEDPFQLEEAFQDIPQLDDTSGTFAALSTVGVIHIDGNGVGAIMRDLGGAFKKTNNTLDKLAKAPYPRKPNPCGKKSPRFRPYCKLPPRFRSYSRKPPRFQWFVMEVNYRLDGVVKAAVASAWKDLEDYAHGRSAPPVVPVLVGGDDLTVYVEGQFAIPFAESYVRHYEQLTGEDELLSKLAVIANAPKQGPLTASAGVAIVGRNFPFHIAYDLAEDLVSRGKKLGKKKDEAPCSTIDFHVLRDATVLDPEETLAEYKGRTQRPFLVGHYAPERIGEATTTSSTAKSLQTRDQWKEILRTVAVFDGKKPDNPTQTTGDPFPRARANRIVKLLAEGEGEKAATEWDYALQNAPSAGRLAKQLKLLPPHSSSSDEAGEALEQIKWLLDLIDLSENLPDGYLASRIGQGTDGAGFQETADDSTEGGAK